MAVGNVEFPEMKQVSGIKLGTSNAGIKQTERDDILLVKWLKAQRVQAFIPKTHFVRHRYILPETICCKIHAGC